MFISWRAVNMIVSSSNTLSRCNATNQYSQANTSPGYIEWLYAGIISGRRDVLSKAITLIESYNANKQALANQLLTKLAHYSQRKTHSLRIGLSGPPGAGKSTFIDCFGMHLLKKGYKVAVLAVDPSSHISHGALLGDKTRMTRLSKEMNAYIRASPSGRALGGVTYTTHSVINLYEAAGYDVIIVETVGAGQSDVVVSSMTDCFILILPPSSGDELQGLKKGVVEMCDIILVNKADGDLVPAARKVQTDYMSAMRILKPRYIEWNPRVLMISSRNNTGIDEAWNTVLEYWSCIKQSNHINRKRQLQLVELLWSNIKSLFTQYLMSIPTVKQHIDMVEYKVKQGILPPNVAAHAILQSYIDKK